MKKTRRYDLDWLRVIAILILLFYHVGMIFVPWGFHIKNEETDRGFANIMIWLHQWRMPLLLFISGAGTYFAMGHRTIRQFAKERNYRLLVPLIFGMLVVVPPQIYYERIDQFSSYGEFYLTVLQFVPYPMGGSVSWHHLWFILYLLIYSMMTIPLLKFLKSSNSDSFKEKMYVWMRRPGFILSWVLIMIISQTILRPIWPNETHALIDDWAYFTFYYLFYLAGLIVCSDERFWKTLLNQRHLNLAATGVATTIFYILWFNWEAIELTTSPMFMEYAWGISKITVAWFWVVAIVGYGQKYLNFNNKWLPRANEGIYPFYILHQTAIIIIGYYVIQWDWSIQAKFWVISLLSLVSSVLFYWWFIYPFNVIRPFFGMKPKKAKGTTSVKSVPAMKPA